MEIRTLLQKNRSYRRFEEDQPVSEETLTELVDLARYCPSGANRQPLKYMVVSDRMLNAEISDMLFWAKCLKDWPGPEPGERPGGYIIILGDTEISHSFWGECGIAAQTMLLGAVERGLGGCMIGAVNRPELCDLLQIPSRYEVMLVLALGVPKETVVVEEAVDPENTAYYRDEDGVHHVPKRPLAEVLLPVRTGRRSVVSMDEFETAEYSFAGES